MPEQNKSRHERLIGIIQERKRRIWAELRDDLHRQTSGVQPEYEIPQDVGEQSILDMIEDLGLAVADIRQQELTQMEEAEEKLRRGTYGICDKCRQEIDERRLAVVPYAPFCHKCQEEREGPETPPGVTL